MLAEIAMPPAIQALLAARLDRLTPDERHVHRTAPRSRASSSTSDGVVELSSPETREAVADRN